MPHSDENGDHEELPLMRSRQDELRGLARLRKQVEELVTEKRERDIRRRLQQEWRDGIWKLIKNVGTLLALAAAAIGVWNALGFG